jgi:hypothetical protein
LSNAIEEFPDKIRLLTSRDPANPGWAVHTH